MHGLIDRADSDKLKKARNRLAEAAEPEMQPMESPDHFSRFRVPSRLVAISVMSQVLGRGQRRRRSGRFADHEQRGIAGVVGIGIFTRNEEMMWAQLRQGLWTELPDHEDTPYDAPKTCQRS